MNVNEILSLESGNTDRIIFLLEGIFWKAYERSAFLFVTQLKSYQPTRKYIQSSGELIVSIGFPKETLEKVIPGWERLVDTPERVEVKSPVPVDLDGFHFWKDGIKLTSARKRNRPATPKMREPAPILIPGPAEQPETVLPPRTFSGIEKAVFDFDLAHSSPMDCLEFVSRLKMLLVAHG